MSALFLLGYMGMSLVGPLLGNCGKESVLTHSLKITVVEACVPDNKCYFFWLNHYVYC
jgi:hypothetical protein